jgi:CBS domain-containing protein
MMSTHLVEEQMTKALVTILDSETLDEAYTLMYRNKIRHLVVKNKRGEVVGVLSDRDVQRAMQSKISESFGFKLESVKFEEGSRVLDYMSWPVKTFTTDTDIKIVIQKMLSEKVSAFLISTASESEIVGIVTTDDFLHLLMRLLDDSDEDKPYVLGDVLSNPLFGRLGQMVSDVGI